MKQPKRQHQMEPSERKETAPVLALVGDQRSRAELLHARLAPVVNRLVWSFLGVDADRDDLVHDIFVRILRAAHTVRDPAKLEDWAARVTVNCIKNEFRRRKLRRIFSLEAHEEAPSMRYHPDFEGRELLLRTTRILETLPIDERIPLTLHLLQQSTMEQIAEVSGTSQRTARRRLKAARERFERLARRDPLLCARLSDEASGEQS